MGKHIKQGCVSKKGGAMPDQGKLPEKFIKVPAPVQVAKRDFDTLLDASVNYCAWDLRPFQSVEGAFA